MSQEQHDQIKAEQDDALERALNILGEHFEAVQIMASTVTYDDGGTSLRSQGRGNYYARKGMIHEFVEHGMAEEIAVQIQSRQ